MNSVSWHPNGAEILFTQVVDDQWGIYRLKLFDVLDGMRVLTSFNPGTPQLVTPINSDFGLSTQARWSPAPLQGKHWIAYNDEVIPGSNDRDLFLQNLV